MPPVVILLRVSDLARKLEDEVVPCRKFVDDPASEFTVRDRVAFEVDRGEIIAGDMLRF